MTDINILEAVGGKAEVQKTLTNAVLREISSPSKVEEINELCELGRNGLRSLREVLEDSSLMDGQIFSRLSLVLGLDADTVLAPMVENLPNDLIDRIRTMIIDGEAGVVAAVGGDLAGITAETQIPIFVTLRLLDQLDE